MLSLDHWLPKDFQSIVRYDSLQTHYISHKVMWSWDTYGFVSPKGNFADYVIHIAECLTSFFLICYPSDKCHVSHVTPVTYVTLQNLFKLHGLLKSQKCYETFK